jgi:hypothetical protein
MKNQQLPSELANDHAQLLGDKVPNLELDHDDIHHDTVLCTCGCNSVLVDLREHTDTQAVCTNCGGVFLPDLCTQCGRDCRPANNSMFNARCSQCHD